MENQTMRSDRFAVLEKISFILLCALMADCCICGSGRMFMLGPVSVRMLLFGFTILTAVPLVLRRWKTLVTNKILWAFAVWFVWLMISTVMGIVKGNNLSVIITDLKGFAYFAILPVALCLLYNTKRTHILMKVMMYASGVLGLLILWHFCLFLWNGELFMKLYNWGINCRFSGISRITATIPRLFFYSTNYLLVGCAFATYFQVINKKLRLDMCLLTGINLICLLMSYTRSVYLAVGVAIFVLVLGFVLFAEKTRGKRFWTHICLSVVAFCLVLTGFGIATKTNYVSYAVTRTLLSFETPPAEETEPDDSSVKPTKPDSTKPTKPDSTKPTKPDSTKPTKPTDPSTEAAQNDTLRSDMLRSDIQQELLKMIRISPVIGHGLGAALEWRAVNEYFYLDLTAKTGMIGLFLYFFPLLAAVIQVLKQRKAQAVAKFRTAAWVCVLMGFMAFSYFNPYMNAALGVLFYCCTLAAANAAVIDESCTQ